MGVYSSVGAFSYNNTIDHFPYGLDSEEIEVNESFLMDSTRAASEILVQSEQNWKTLMEAVGISELNEIETGVVTEAGSTGGFFAGVKKFFANLFKKIAGLFKTLLMKIMAGCSDAEKFCEKYKNEINKLTVPEDFEYEGYKFSNIDNKLTFNDGGIASKTLSDLKFNDFNGFNVNNNDITNLLAAAKENDKKTELKDAIRGGIIPGNSGSLEESEWDDKLFEYFHNNEKDPVTISDIEPRSYRDTITKSSTYKQQINASFTEAKTAYNKLLSDLEKAENEINNKMPGKTEEDENNQEKYSKMLTACRTFIELKKFSWGLQTEFYNAGLNTIQERNRQYKAVLVKLLSKSMTKGAKNESVDFGISHYNALDNLNFI